MTNAIRWCSKLVIVIVLMFCVYLKRYILIILSNKWIYTHVAFLAPIYSIHKQITDQEETDQSPTTTTARRKTNSAHKSRAPRLFLFVYLAVVHGALSTPPTASNPITHIEQRPSPSGITLVCAIVAGYNSPNRMYNISVLHWHKQFKFHTRTASCASSVGLIHPHMCVGYIDFEYMWRLIVRSKRHSLAYFGVHSFDTSLDTKA